MTTECPLCHHPVTAEPTFGDLERLVELLEAREDFWDARAALLAADNIDLPPDQYPWPMGGGGFDAWDGETLPVDRDELVLPELGPGTDGIPYRERSISSVLESIRRREPIEE